MIPTTALLTLVWCLVVIVTSSFEIQHPTKHYQPRRYGGGMAIKLMEKSSCCNIYPMIYYKRRRRILLGLTDQSNELEKEVCDNDTLGSTTASSSSPASTPTNSDTVSNFNPFQYDATSVRIQNDRWNIMSTIRPNDNDDTTTQQPQQQKEENPTVFPSLSTKIQKSNNNDHRISIRSITMKQIMNEMMNVVPDYDKVRDILQSNQDFLLEVLDDDNTIQEPDSTYLYCKNRKERYMTFHENLQGRIQSAQNPSVQQILIYYHDFVMSHQ